jgi:hypothetical protein
MVFKIMFCKNLLVLLIIRELVSLRTFLRLKKIVVNFLFTKIMEKIIILFLLVKVEELFHFSKDFSYKKVVLLVIVVLVLFKVAKGLEILL